MSAPSAAELIKMCNNCGNHQVAGLKDLDGVCIRCIQRELMQFREGIQPLMSAIHDLKAMYGNKLYAAPGPIQMVFEAAEACKGGALYET